MVYTPTCILHTITVKAGVVGAYIKYTIHRYALDLDKSSQQQNIVSVGWQSTSHKQMQVDPLLVTLLAQFHNFLLHLTHPTLTAFLCGPLVMDNQELAEFPAKYNRNTRCKQYGLK